MFLWTVESVMKKVITRAMPGRSLVPNMVMHSPLLTIHKKWTKDLVDDGRESFCVEYKP